MPRCPECRKTGRKVKRATLDSLLCAGRRPDIGDGPYHVCVTPDCDTVYFSAGGDETFGKRDLAVRFGLKEASPPRPVCYCFDHTVEEIHDEIRRTGRSTVSDSIKADMDKSGCRCESTNPLGGCCLNTVEEVVQEGFRAYEMLHEAVSVQPRRTGIDRGSANDCRQNDLIAGSGTFWFFWGLPIVTFVAAGLLPPTPRLFVWAGALMWAGTGCLINSRRCGRLHCYITGPLWVLGGVAILLHGLGIVPLPMSWMAIPIIGGTILAFVLERIRGSKYLSRSDYCETTGGGSGGCCSATQDDSQAGAARGDRSGALVAGGSVLAAVLSSACCWLPLLLITFGASAAGVAGFFEAYRPYLIAAAVILLGAGFYMAYFRAESCKPGSACEAAGRKMRTFNRVTLWAATALVVGFVFFPNYVGSAFGRLGAPIPAATSGAGAHLVSAEFHIEGMTCAGCADMLRSTLAKLPDVADVGVDYAKKTAVVRYPADKPVPSDRVIEAVRNAGYTATLSPDRSADPIGQGAG
ncbi:MAG: mercuric transporter MerT family protein [Phycisphaerae bacterium]